MQTDMEITEDQLAIDWTLTDSDIQFINKNSNQNIKFAAQLCHLRADGRQEDTGERINVCGVDIDLERYKLYKFTSNSKELEYYYIDYPTEPGHVF